MSDSITAKWPRRYFLFLAILLNIFFISLPLETFAQSYISTAQDESFYSRILPTRDGQQTLVKYRVILPKDYQSTNWYSVVYFLHGRDSNRFMLEELGVMQRLDQWEGKRGKINFIFVSPECGNCYWMNAALINERWGDVVTQELVKDVEKNIEFIADPGDVCWREYLWEAMEPYNSL